MNMRSSGSYPPLRHGVFAIVLLVLGIIISLIDRQVLSLLVGPIRADLGISDTQFSLLQGLAFVVLYATAGLPLGYAVDRLSRRNLIIGCLLAWSTMTMLCGLARNFWQLFAARVGVGLGEAGMHPAAYSMACDYFEPRHRGKAFGFLGLASSLGIGASLMGGGLLYAWLVDPANAAARLFADLAAWQKTFIFAGVPGFILAVLLLALKEPKRQDVISAQDTSSPIKPTVAFLRSKKHVLGPLLTHYALYTLCAYSILGWGPALYMRVHDASILEAGLIMGTIILSGGLGSILTGILGDRWTRQRAPGRRLRASFVSAIFGVPAMLLWSLAENQTLSILGGIVSWGMIALTSTAAPLAIADIVPNSLRGRMSSIYLFIVTVFGAIFGPICVAVMTDSVFQDDRLINYSLAAVMIPTMLISTVVVTGVFKRYAIEVDSVHEQTDTRPATNALVPGGLEPSTTAG